MLVKQPREKIQELHLATFFYIFLNDRKLILNNRKGDLKKIESALIGLDSLITISFIDCYKKIL